MADFRPFSDEKLDQWIASGCSSHGLPIIAFSIVVLNWLLPRSLSDSIDPLWRFLLPIIPAAHLIVAIQGKRKSAARKQFDYPRFTAYLGAMQSYGNAMKTYRYLQRKDRYDEFRRKRQQASLIKEQSRAKWRGIDGRAFEIEVVKILFSKGMTLRTRADQGVAMRELISW